MMSRKGCPLLVQRDQMPSYTVPGECYTRSYMLECLGDKCVAYREKDGYCRRFLNYTIIEAVPTEEDEI